MVNSEGADAFSGREPLDLARPAKLSEVTLKKIVQSVITNQMALDFNEEIKHTGYYKHKLKQTLNASQKELLKAEKKEYSGFLARVEEQSDLLYNFQFEMISQLTSLGVVEFGEMTNVLRAFKKDKKSLMGIVKKINKNK